LVIAEAGGGDEDAARKRLNQLNGVPILSMGDTTRQFAAQLIEKGGVPAEAQADALHIAVASVNELDYLLTWNCRHIDNAAAKPLIRSICAVAGYPCPEICTPLELLSEDCDYVSR